jgi:hypothetical protein
MTTGKPNAKAFRIDPPYPTSNAVQTGIGANVAILHSIVSARERIQKDGLAAGLTNI